MTGIKHFVAARADGLGGRLCALLNTIRAADAVGWPYKFIWPPMRACDTAFHAIDDAAHTFTADYLEEHLVRELDHSEYLAVDRDTLHRDLPDLEQQPELRGVVLTHWKSPARLPVPARLELHECVDLIGFHPQVVEVRQRVADLGLQDRCAIHLRRGDIIYGQFRHDLYYHKYVPLGVLKRVLDYLSDCGTRVVLISEEPELCRYLQQRYDVDVGSDFSHGIDFNPVQQAFFDIFLLASCRLVMGRGSAFSNSARLVGGAEYQDVVDTFQRLAVARAIESDLEMHSDDYQPLQVAKELTYVADLRVLPSARNQECLLRGIELDPENYTYVRKYVVSLIESKRWGELERIIGHVAEDALKRSGYGTWWFLPNHKHKNMPEHELELAVRAAETSGAPYTRAYCSYLLEHAAETERALRFAESAYRENSHSPAIAVRYVRLLVKLEKFEEGHAVLTSTAVDWSEMPVMHSLMGDIQLNLKQRVQSAESFVKAFDLGGDPYDAIRAANSYQGAKMPAKADEYLALAIREGGDNPTVRYWESKLAEKRGDYEAAVEAAGVAHFLNPVKKRYINRLNAMRKMLRATRSDE